MPILAPLDLPASLAPGQRLMGLDLGTKTLGLALSDTRLMVATPYQTLARGKFGATSAELMRLAAKEGAGGFVLGLPLNMDGSEGPRAQATRAFARNLMLAYDPPLSFWDERLSTAAVTRQMIEADLSRRARAARVDKAAAAYILEGLLDRLARHRATTAGQGQR